jgi:uncharacterized membrane protein HdeD (DUF308 family)
MKRANFMESQKHRPLGVTIVAILLIVVGIISIISGLVLLIILIGIIPLALGIAYLVMAYGLWKGLNWARIISLILAGIGIVMGIVYIIQNNLSGGIITIIINGVIIYYLNRPNVKAFFGR